MNTAEFYQRRLDRSLPAPAAAPSAEQPVDPLARYGDPSVQAVQPTQEGDRVRPGVAWVRPSELATVLGSRYVSRGIEVEADLARRARRVPGVAVSKATRRITRTSIARPEPIYPPTTVQEGPQL